MTNLLPIATLLAVGCTSTAAPPAAASKVYDFSETPLVEVPAPAPPTGQLSKSTVRAAIQTVQSRLASCANAAPHPAGTIEVTLRLTGDDGGTTVESTIVRAFGVARIESCMRDTLMSIELPPMAEAAVWSINYPFSVEANS